MDVQKKLQAILEGAIEVQPQVITEADEEMQAIFAEAAWELMLAEAESMQIQESANDLLFAQLVLEAAEATTPDAQASVLAKMKQKLVAFRDKFDPYEGLKELKAANILIQDTKYIRKQSFWFGYIGIFIAIHKIAKRYKEMDPKIKKQYLDEAVSFHKTLEKKVDEAKKVGDLDGVQKLQRQLKKLDKLIKSYKGWIERE